MKIKTDFVTNSSTVSFCGFGATFSLKELREMLKDWVSEIVPDPKDDTEFENKVLYPILHKNRLTMEVNDSEQYFIGKTFANAHEDETIGGIKREAERQFERIGLTKKVEFIEESWRDS